MNGSGLQNQSLVAVARCWDKFLTDLVSPAPAKGLLAAGSGFIGSPKRSYCIAELPNGGVQIVNPPDCDDDRMESRRWT